jgi:hypothetical protein
LTVGGDENDSMPREEPIGMRAPDEPTHLPPAADQVQAATRENVHSLQQVASYLLFTRNLRGSGNIDVLVGCVICLVALIMLGHRFLSVEIAGLAALGALLIGGGIWFLSRPTPIGMLVDGAMMLAVLVAVATLAIDPRHIVFRQAILMPFLYLLAGGALRRLYGVRQYRRFASAAAVARSETTGKWLGGLVDSTLQAEAGSDPQVVSFVGAAFLGLSRKWKGRLLPEVAIFVQGGNETGEWGNVLFAARDNVRIASVLEMLVMCLPPEQQPDLHANRARERIGIAECFQPHHGHPNRRVF